MNLEKNHEANEMEPDNLEIAIDSLVKKSKLTRKEITKQINDIVKDFNNLVTPLGAALIIADKMGIDLKSLKIDKSELSASTEQEEKEIMREMAMERYDQIHEGIPKIDLILLNSETETSLLCNMHNHIKDRRFRVLELQFILYVKVSFFTSEFYESMLRGMKEISVSISTDLGDKEDVAFVFDVVDCDKMIKKCTNNPTGKVNESDVMAIKSAPAIMKVDPDYRLQSELLLRINDINAIPVRTK